MIGGRKAEGPWRQRQESRVTIDPSAGYKDSSLVSESQVTFISLPYDYCSTASTLRAKSDGVVAIVLLRARPQSGSAALVIRIGVGVRAVALCRGESLNKHIRGEICCKTTH